MRRCPGRGGPASTGARRRAPAGTQPRRGECASLCDCHAELPLGVSRGQRLERVACLLESITTLDRHSKLAAFDELGEPLQVRRRWLRHDVEATWPFAGGADW